MPAPNVYNQYDVEGAYLRGRNETEATVREQETKIARLEDENRSLRAALARREPLTTDVPLP